MKKFIYSLSLLLFLGCGGGSTTKVSIPENDIDFLSTDGVSGSIVFKKVVNDDFQENFTIESITADGCEVEPISPISFTLSKDNPYQSVSFSVSFKNPPCYTDKITLHYKKQTLDSVENKSLTIINPQYDQSKVYKEAGDDPLYKYQWYLKNTGQDFGIVRATPGEDINVSPVWNEGITGRGVTVAVIDTGVDMFHPDLKDNIDWEDSYNYITGTLNTTPLGDKPDSAPTDQYSLAHATAVAGIIAAKGWNGIGTRGVAPNAKIASMNPLVMLSGQESEDGYSDAQLQMVRMLDSLVRNLNHIDIYNNSWGGDPTTLNNSELNDSIDFDTQITYGVKFGRDGKGAIYVKSAGNSGDNSNANFEQLQTNGNWIVVGAVGADGKKTSYSTPGSAILVSAPGGAVNPDYTRLNELEIVTTDLAGDKRGFDREDVLATIMPHFDVKGNENYDYTYYMNGTSSAAPIVSGVIALMLEANPNLTYRDVKIILAKTSRKNDPLDSGWRTNAAGLHFNYKYGFGVVDAKSAVDMAKNFRSVGGYRDVNTTSISLSPDINSTNQELNITLPISKNLKIEDVKLYLTIKNINATTNSIKITLISPSGTKSILVDAPNSLSDSDEYNNTRLLSTNFMLENSRGNWTLDLKSLNGEFQLKNVKLEITGH